MALSFPEAPTAAWLAALRARPPEAPDALRLPPAGRRHRPPAGATHGLHHRPSARCRSGSMVRRDDGAGRRRPARLRHASATRRWAWLLRQGSRRWPQPGACRGPRRTTSPALSPPRAAARPGAALRAIRLAAMDLSDGLVKDLERHAARLAARGALPAADVPLSDAAAEGPRSGARALAAADHGGGDDYEVLAAVSAGYRRVPSGAAARRLPRDDASARSFRDQLRSPSSALTASRCALRADRLGPLLMRALRNLCSARVATTSDFWHGPARIWHRVRLAARLAASAGRRFVALRRSTPQKGELDDHGYGDVGDHPVRIALDRLRRLDLRAVMAADPARRACRRSPPPSRRARRPT